MQIRIRKFTEEDIPNKVRWINDFDNNQYLHYDLPLEREKTKKWFESVKKRTDRYDAVIECDGVAVGIIGLLSISNREAEYYITLGEKEFKGKGIALEASKLLLDYAKGQLNLKKIYLYTEAGNLRAQRLFEKIGFERGDLEENSANNRGIPVDRYRYEILL